MNEAAHPIRPGRAAPKPTEGEIAILAVLWRLGPSSVRAVCDELNRERPTGYTTVLKMMQLMKAKGQLERDERQRVHVYRPRHREDETQRQLVGDLARRAFAGSAKNLALQALSPEKASPEEMARIRRLLDQI